MSIPRLPQARRAMLLVVALVLTMTAGSAAAQELYTIRGIEVDATAESAAAARDAGIAMGQSRALQRLFERLVSAEDQGRLPRLNADQVADLVQDFSVSGERVSDVRYRANLTVRFRGEDVRALLRRSGVGFAETRSPAVVVVPLFTREGTTRLWDDPNPWRRAWFEYGGSGGLVPLMVPLGDLEDMLTLDVQQALAGDRDALEALAARHDARDVLVLEAALQGDPESGGARLTVRSTRYGGGTQALPTSTVVDQRSGEDMQALMRRAVAAVDEAIQQDWRGRHVIRHDERGELVARVSFRALEDWLAVRRALAETGNVERSQVLELSRNEASVRIAYYGTTEQLAQALSHRDLSLIERPDGPEAEARWELRRGGSGAFRNDGSASDSEASGLDRPVSVAE